MAGGWREGNFLPRTNNKQQWQGAHHKRAGGQTRWVSCGLMTLTLTKGVPPTDNSGTGDNAVCRGKHVWVHPAVGGPSLASAEYAPFRLDGVVRNWLTGVSGGGNGGCDAMRCGLERERCGYAQILTQVVQRT